MSLTRLNVHFTSRSDKTVYMTRTLLSQLDLSGAKTLRISLGKHTIEAPVRLIRKPGKHLYLSPYLRTKLMIPKAGLCYVVRDGANGIRLGPLVGVMTTSRTPSRSSIIRPYISAGHKRSFYFAFHPEDVNWASETVRGYFLTASGELDPAHRPPARCCL